jgi:hypothetical protein
MLMASYLKRMGLESSEADKAEASTEFWPGGWIKQQTVHRSSGRDGSESKALATITMLSGCMSSCKSDEEKFINLKGITATGAYNWKQYLLGEGEENWVKSDILKDDGMEKFLQGEYLAKLESQYLHSKQLAEQPKGFFERLLGG